MAPEASQQSWAPNPMYWQYAWSPGIYGQYVQQSTGTGQFPTPGPAPAQQQQHMWPQGMYMYADPQNQGQYQAQWYAAAAQQENAAQQQAWAHHQALAQQQAQQQQQQQQHHEQEEWYQRAERDDGYSSDEQVTPPPRRATEPSTPPRRPRRVSFENPKSVDASTSPIFPSPEPPSRQSEINLSKIIISPDGHARVVVHCTDEPDKSSSFRVSHHSMSRDASRWRELKDFNFTATFSASQPQAVEAMEYLLRIIHREEDPAGEAAPTPQGLPVPDQLSLAALGYLAAFSRQLGSRDCLHVWLYKWLRGLDKQVATRDVTWVMYIAREFGDHRLFELATRSVQFCFEINPQGEFLDNTGLLLHTLPEEDMNDVVKPVLGSMKGNRREAIERLLKTVSDAADQLLMRRGHTVCSAQPPMADRDDRRRCEALAYGLLATRLADAGMWPLPDPKVALSSAQWVRDRLRPALEEPPAGWLPRAHQDCRVFKKVLGDLDQVMELIPVPELE